MNNELFLTNWAAAPKRIQRALHDFARFPTESNRTYLTGYISGTHQAGSLDFDAAYWIAYINLLTENSQAQNNILKALE